MFRCCLLLCFFFLYIFWLMIPKLLTIHISQKDRTSEHNILVRLNGGITSNGRKCVFSNSLFWSERLVCIVVIFWDNRFLFGFVSHSTNITCRFSLVFFVAKMSGRYECHHKWLYGDSNGY